MLFLTILSIFDIIEPIWEVLILISRIHREKYYFERYWKRQNNKHGREIGKSRKKRSICSEFKTTYKKLLFINTSLLQSADNSRAIRFYSSRSIKYRMLTRMCSISFGLFVTNAEEHKLYRNILKQLFSFMRNFWNL